MIQDDIPEVSLERLEDILDDLRYLLSEGKGDEAQLKERIRAVQEKISQMRANDVRLSDDRVDN